MNPHPYRRHTSPPTHFPEVAAICPIFRAYLDLASILACAIPMAPRARLWEFPGVFEVFES